MDISGVGVKMFRKIKEHLEETEWGYWKHLTHSVHQSNKLIETVKASELSLKPDLLFIRNSLSGAIQCKPNKRSVVLNDQLHSND